MDRSVAPILLYEKAHTGLYALDRDPHYLVVSEHYFHHMLFTYPLVFNGVPYPAPPLHNSKKRYLLKHLS